MHNDRVVNDDDDVWMIENRPRHLSIMPARRLRLCSQVRACPNVLSHVAARFLSPIS